MITPATPDIDLARPPSDRLPTIYELQQEVHALSASNLRLKSCLEQLIDLVEDQRDSAGNRIDSQRISLIERRLHRVESSLDSVKRETHSPGAA